MAKKATKPKQTRTQAILAKIAKEHRDKYKQLTAPAVEVKKRPRKKLTSIPEDLRIAVKLQLDEYGDVIFGNFRFRDLQRACIIRGMPPEELVNQDIYGLHRYIQDHKNDDVDIDLLEDFDEWREKLLEEKYGKGEPFVRLGYIGKVDEEGKPVMVYQAKPKKPKKHIEKDAEMGGLWKGTKKHLTMQCKKDGLSLEKTVSKVIAQFPEAKESSIKIWYKRA